jgi:hypothetical protein
VISQIVSFKWFSLLAPRFCVPHHQKSAKKG